MIYPETRATFDTRHRTKYKQNKETQNSEQHGHYKKQKQGMTTGAREEDYDTYGQYGFLQNNYLFILENRLITSISTSLLRQLVYYA